MESTCTVSHESNKTDKILSWLILLLIFFGSSIECIDIVVHVIQPPKKKKFAHWSEAEVYVI